MEVCFKIIFICENVFFMGVIIGYPITMHTENLGVILLSYNTSVYEQKYNIGSRPILFETMLNIGN